MKKQQRWLDVYPQGTKEGDEEQKFFIALARNKKWKWRSVDAISQTTGLSVKRVEEIIDKYQKNDIVVRNPNSDGQWGYWERIDSEKDDKSINKKDQDDRIQKGA